jgi:hypothetical protein
MTGVNSRAEVTYPLTEPCSGRSVRARAVRLSDSRRAHIVAGYPPPPPAPTPGTV